MNTKDKKNQVGYDFSLVLNDSGADVFHSSRDIVKKLVVDETHTIRYIACIYHDQDFNDLGDKKTPHYHLVIGFLDRFRLGSILNYIVDTFHCNENQVSIEKCTDIGAQSRYLIHLDHPEKHRYNADDVVTNSRKEFDDFCAHICVMGERHLCDIVHANPSVEKLIVLLGFKQYRKYAVEIHDLLRNRY